MLVDTGSLVSINKTNLDFLRVIRIVDENGIAVIIKNNAPRYIVVEYSIIDSPAENISNEILSRASKMMIERNRVAYEELVK